MYRIRHSFIMFGFAILMMQSLFAADNSFRWGAQGYDPDLKEISSKRFAVQQHYGEKKLVDIVVDSKDAQSGIGEIRLISADKKLIFSNTCWKAMRHITAPLACSFQKDDLKNLLGLGKIQVVDKNQNIIHEDEIDFEKLNVFLKGSES